MGTNVWTSVGVVAAVLGLGTFGAAWGCSAILGLDAKTLGELDGGGPGEAGMMEAGAEASAVDSGRADGGDSSLPDTGSPDSGPSGACATDGGATPGYHDMTSPTCWSTFDPSIVDSNAKAFAGAAFDGRYVYFAPIEGGGVARLDTTGQFSSATAWATYDLPNPGNGTSYQGAVFDGHYVYLVPDGTGVPVARYDTTAPFTAAASWTSFDPAQLDPNAINFAGATFDGRYVYLAPNALSSSAGLLARYDTHAPFATASSWSTFDATTLNPAISGFFGALYDGRYVYFVPDGTADPAIAARYDTTASFSVGASWTSFSLTMVSSNGYAFQGAAFDGHSIYFAPSANSNGAPGGTALSYQVGSTFNATSSWASFPPAQLNPAITAYNGAAFDGRYVYFAPNGGSDVPNNVLLRYDTTAKAFASNASWGTLDLTTVDPGASDFEGAVFDGRYVYLVPLGSSTVARFDARAPGPLPLDAGVPFYGSSFF